MRRGPRRAVPGPPASAEHEGGQQSRQPPSCAAAAGAARRPGQLRGAIDRHHRDRADRAGRRGGVSRPSIHGAACRGQDERFLHTHINTFGTTASTGREMAAFHSARHSTPAAHIARPPITPAPSLSGLSNQIISSLIFGPCSPSPSEQRNGKPRARTPTAGWHSTGRCPSASHPPPLRATRRQRGSCRPATTFPLAS